MVGKHRRLAGFSIVELITTLGLVSILAMLAVPRMSSFFDSKRLIGAAEQVYSHLQQTRLESIARSDGDMFVNFSADGTTTWQYGVSHNAACDLTTTTPTDANACVLVIDDGDGNAQGNTTADAGDLVLMHFTGSDHDDVAMSIVNFASGTDIGFNQVRGTAETGDIKFTSGSGKLLTVRVLTLGQIRICSPDGSVPGFSSADCI